VLPRFIAVLTSAALALSCRDRRDASGSGAVPSESASSGLPTSWQRVAVAERGFSLSLPQGWAPKHPMNADDANVYVAADGSAAVTVSSLSSTTFMDDAKRQETLSSLLEHRREAERKAMGEKMTVAEPRRDVKGGVCFARYEGTDPAVRHLFATIVLVSTTGAWTFFFETEDRGTMTFHQQADAIFASIEVAP
jgi:hypothetical protein